MGKVDHRPQERHGRSSPPPSTSKVLGRCNVKAAPASGHLQDRRSSGTTPSRRSGSPLSSSSRQDRPSCAARTWSRASRLAGRDPAACGSVAGVRAPRDPRRERDPSGRHVGDSKAGTEHERRATESGIAIERVYDAASIDGPRSRRAPGRARARSRTPAASTPRCTASKPWTMRQYAGFATAEETNERFRYLLAAGRARASRPPSTCRPSSAWTPTTRSPPARWAGWASPSTRSRTWAASSTASRSTASPRA